MSIYRDRLRMLISSGWLMTSVLTGLPLTHLHVFPANAGLMDAFYFKMPAATTIRYCISSDATFPGWKDMKVGWNFIGLAELITMDAESALADAYWGTGQTDLIGYQRVMSPSLNERAPWTFVREDISIPDMYPTEGYWVFMVNDGTLGGFTTTPIVEEGGG